MSEQYFSIRHQGQKVHVDVTKITGSGGQNSPSLIIPISFIVTPLSISNKQQSFGILGVDAKMYVKGLNNCIAKANNTLHRKVSYSNEFYYSLEFELDSVRLSQIEKLRNPNLEFTIQLTVHLCIYNSMKLKEGAYDTSYEFVSEFEDIDIPALPLEIPQSNWVNKILPAMGYEGITIIEVPSASKLINEVQKTALDELTEAIKYFQNCDYDKTVAHCRSALDPIRNKLKIVKDEIKGKTEKDWISDTVNETDIWLTKVVDSTYNISSKSHHNPSTGHFSRAQAESIYLMTTSILVYTGTFDLDRYRKK